MEFSLHNTLVAWEWSPFAIFMLAVVIAVAVWYLRADWRLALRGRRWPTARTASFLGGLVAVDLALQSPVATYTMHYFQAHVIQHLLLMIVAPPLLAMGAPSTLLLQTASRKIKTRWLAILRSRPFAVISHPISAWFLYFGAMYVFFLTSLINVAMTHMALMDVVNLIFLFGGTLYWWPMVGIDPILHWKMSHGAWMLNVLIGTGFEAFLGVAILSSTRPEASMYSLTSTHSGGAILWASTEFATIGAFLPIFFQWMKADARSATRADARDMVEPAVLGDLEDSGPGPDDELVGEHRSGDLVDRPPMSLWESEWLARTGSVPDFGTKS